MQSTSLLLLCLVSAGVVAHLPPGCRPCLDPYNAFCPPPPEGCEEVENPCGCCKLCAGKVGEACGGRIGPCETGLTCKDGVCRGCKVKIPKKCQRRP